MARFNHPSDQFHYIIHQGDRMTPSMHCTALESAPTCSHTVVPFFNFNCGADYVSGECTLIQEKIRI